MAEKDKKRIEEPDVCPFPGIMCKDCPGIISGAKSGETLTAPFFTYKKSGR